MSWWDTSNFSNLASQALKNAQKKIDKVLDIEEKDKRKAAAQKAAESTKEKEPEEKRADGGDFWSTWVGSGGQSTPSSDSKDTSSAVPSQWSLPWGSGSDESKTNTDKGTGDTIDSSELPSVSKLSSQGSKRNKPKSPEPPIIVQEEEGKWVGDTDDKPATTPLFTERIHEDGLDLERGDYSYSRVKEQEGVKGDDRREVENVQYPELEAIAEDDNLLQSEVSHSSVEMFPVENIVDVEKTLASTEGSPPKSVFDVQEESISSSSGWDISDSIVKPVDKSDYSSSDETTDTKNHELSGGPNIVENADSSSVSGDISVKGEQTHFEAGSTAENDSPATSDTHSLHAREEIFEETSIVQVNVENSFATIGGTMSKSSDVCDFKEHGDDIDVKESSDRQGSEDDILRQDEMEVDKGEEKIESNVEGLIQGYVSVSTPLMESQSKQGEEQSLSDLELATSATSSEFEVPVGPASSTGSSDAGRLDTSAETLVDRGSLDVEREDHYSLFDDGKSNEDGDGGGKASGGNDNVIGDMKVSPASSFVKCMLEDAMEESCKEDSGSDNHSNGSKSESSKLDSEGDKSVYSGQESSDDIETTTSSDIEIISASGLGLQDKQQFGSGFDLPQLKIAISQRSSGADRHSYQHYDSRSSSSTQSKGGDHDELSPERGEGHSWRDEELQHPDLASVQEEGSNNPYHPERLLQKLAEMAEVLQARETKLVSMSKDNHRLLEDNSILRSQLQQSEETRESETADLKALTGEFTNRIGESEKKLQSTIREKESLKQQLIFTQTELEKRSPNADIEMILEEKTEQVKELLAEGEKLSKQQLQSSTIIKKLRAKEKESDTTITSQKKKIEDLTTELDRLKTVLDSKEDMETKQSDAINQMNSAVQKREQDYTKLVSDLEDAQEKNRGLQTALDNAYKEISELHRSNASQDSKAQEEALSKETSLREEMKMTLDREQQRFRQERAAFVMQADDLRLDMTRLEKEHNRREDLLREEISHLQERLQQDEARSQDVSQSITAATRPLLRQIENLQATHAAQSTAWEKVEKNLTDRFAEIQMSLALAQDKERSASESEMELRAKMTSLDLANGRLKQERAQLMAQKEADQLRLEELQDARTSFIAQLETSKQGLNQELTQIKIQKVQLESKYNAECNKLENEKKKAAALEEQLRIMERDRPKSRGTPSPSPSMSVSRQDSLMGSFYERNSPGANFSFSEDFMDTGTPTGSEVRGPTSRTSVYESLRQSGATIVVENLQSQLKLKEGEITHLQSEIAQLERTRESMARELVNLSNQNDELMETKKTFEALEEQHKELNNRYSAILLMYGEKEEQVQELSLDLQDVKEMYKTQIDALLAQ